MVGLLVCVSLLLGVAPASRLTALALPVPPEPVDLLAVPVDLEAPRALVRPLPVGLPHGRRATRPSDLETLAVRALGGQGAAALITELRRRDLDSTLTHDHAGAYPGRYPVIERLLDSAPARAATLEAAALAAELISFAAVDAPDLDPAQNAGPVAYALLLRARRVAGCDAEVNLLLLLAADNQPHDDLVRGQARRAVAACSGDPTPGWVWAQFQSQRALVANASQEHLGQPLPADRIERATAAVTQLERHHPGSPDAWTAEGDLRLRLAAERLPAQPFSSRYAYQTALAAFVRAADLGSGLPATVGQARALLGLGRPAEAADLLANPELAPAYDGPVLNLRIQALEEARRFAEAQRAAEQLLALGATAYPQVGPVFPRGEALSTGVDTTVPLWVSLAPEEGGAGGGGEATDLSFIPAFRSQVGVTGSLPHCPEWSRRRDAILAGHPLGRRAAPPLEEFTAARTTGNCGDDASSTTVDTIARREARDPTLELKQSELSLVDDARQNLWRWAGDLGRATVAVTRWDGDTGRKLFLPAYRLAEIRFLQRRYDDAAALFGVAERRAASGHFINLDIARARLARGAALIAADRTEEGISLLRDLDEDTAQVEAQFRLGQFVQKNIIVASYYAVVSYHTRLQLGDAERRAGRFWAAAEDYTAARERDPAGLYEEQVVPGVLENNAALTELSLGRAAEAQAASRRALAADPDSPIFALTAASAAEQAGDRATAVTLHRAVLRRDPTAFPAANNLAVELARQDQVREATGLLRQAVGARDDYAVGWFNLGVLYGRRGPLFLLHNQGALSRAFALDPTLVDRPRDLILDEHVYRTELDLSKPLPAGWSLGRVERRQPLAAVGLLGLLGIAVGLSRVLASGVDSRVQTSLQRGAATLRRFRPLERRRHLGWAAGVTIAVFAVPLAVRSAGSDPTFLLAYVVLLALLVTVLVGVRQLAAAHWQVRAVQRTWSPGLVVGALSGALGVPWAPLPYVRAPARVAGRLHLAGVTTMAVVAALLLIEVAWLPVPLSRAVAVAALTMTASLLVPLRPLDGAALGRTGAVVGAATIAVALLVVLGLL